MNKINGLSFLVVALLAVLVSGCAPATVAPTNTAPPPTFTPSSIPPAATENPPPTKAAPLGLTPKNDWLITTEEIKSFSKDIGVDQWKITNEDPFAKNTVCRYFSGQSWSTSPNLAFNCISLVGVKGLSLNDVIDWLFQAKILYPDEVAVESSLNFDNDFAVYAGTLSNGHSVYELLVLDGDLLYWGSVHIGTPVGNSAVSLYEDEQKIIDEFLKNIIMINMSRNKKD